MIAFNTSIELVQPPKADGADCANCPLAASPCAPTYVPANFDGTLFVGEAPGFDEAQQHVPFVGASGQFLARAYESVGGVWETAARTNTVLCRPPGNRTPTQQEITCCSGRLKADIARIQPQRIVTLGTPARETVSQYGSALVKEGAWGITRFAGHQANTIGVVHPAFILRQPGAAPRFRRALERVAKGPGGDPTEASLHVPPDITVVRTYSELKEVLDSIADNAWVAYDLETNQTRWYNRRFGSAETYRADRILCLALTTGIGYGWIVPDYLIHDTPTAIPLLTAFFARVRTITHNGKFDLQFLRAYGIQSHIDIDTMVAHYCVSPSTRVLRTNLTWVRADALQVGESVVAFDEVDTAEMKPATVTGVKPQKAHTYRIHTEHGDVDCSENHRWLITRAGRANKVWRTTKELVESRSRNYLVRFCSPWEFDDSYEGGYVAGILDGEGWVNFSKNQGGIEAQTVGFAQKQGLVLDRTLDILQRKGFVVRRNLPRDNGVCVQTLIGGTGKRMREGLRALGTFRPSRLLQHSDRMWQGRRKFASSEILSIEDLGEQDVIGIGTTEGTFIAEGWLSHNCTDETPNTHALKPLVAAEFGVPDYEGDLIAKYLKNKGDVYSKIPELPLYTYAVWDVCSTIALAMKLKATLVRQKLWERPFQSLMMPGFRTLANIEFRGVRVDVPYLLKWKDLFEKRAEYLRAQITAYTGREVFNPGSPPQMQWLIFTKLGLPITEPVPQSSGRGVTKRGSTSKDALKQLKGMHPVIDLIGEYRTCIKMLKTYIMGMLAYADEYDRVHTSYSNTTTETGRLASRGPALQNIPKGRTLYGQIIRAAFIPSDGCVFLDADYAQAELRVFAAETKDPFLLKVYQNDEDLHEQVVIAQWGPVEAMTPMEYENRRFIAKIFNFGWAYGGGASMLTNVVPDHAAAQAFVDEYEANMPVAAAWRRRQGYLAQKQGYVQARTGRRRRNLNGTLKPTEAINSPIQGGASDNTVDATIRLEAEQRVQVVLLIHDEIVAEAPIASAEADLQYVIEVMQEAGARNYPEVPWKADGKIKQRWAKELTEEEARQWVTSAVDTVVVEEDMDDGEVE